MGIFSRKEIKPELILLFNIGSSSVESALFETKKGGLPKIIFSIREPITFEDKIDGDKFLFFTLKSLEIVASRTCLSGLGKPSKIFCVLSSPWYASQTRIIKLEKNTPFIFTTKIADDLIKKEVSIFEDENRAKFPNEDNKVRIIELKNMQTKLNGYVTSEPFEKKTKTVEITIFISMSGDKILKAIEGTIWRHFHAENIKFSSFVMASFAVARDMFVYQENFLLADIAGEMTDISIIKKSVLSNSISFPLGRNFMIRRVSGGLNTTLNEARSFLSLYKDGHASKSVEKKLESIVIELKKEWLNEFQRSLVNISEDISIPATIFITVDQDLADFFSEIIKTEQFNQYTLTESKFRIIFLDTKTLHGVTAFGENVDRDPFVIIESIYINRFIC